MNTDDLRRLRSELFGPDRRAEEARTSRRLLVQYVRGHLAGDEITSIEQEIEASEDLQREVADLRTAASAFAASQASQLDSLLAGQQPTPEEATIDLRAAPTTFAADVRRAVARFQDFALGVAEALAPPRPAVGYRGKGHRGGSDEVIHADIRIGQGDSHAEDGGARRTLVFHVARRDVDTGGRAVLELNTSDRAFWPTADRSFAVEARLRSRGQTIQLPTETIDGSGRASIVFWLPVREGFDLLPLWALQVSVRPLGGEA